MEVICMNKLFLLGALGYPALELAYRGRTHYSMALAGGTSAVLIGRIRRLPLSFPTRTVLCGLSITGVEYLCGCIWNKDYQVWDYRSAPLNYRGQLCLPFALLWCGLGAGLMATLDLLDKREKPGS